MQAARENHGVMTIKQHSVEVGDTCQLEDIDTVGTMKEADSDDEADQPEQLKKGRDRNGGLVVHGDVDMEFIFEIIMKNITSNSKMFKSKVAREVAESVDVKLSHIKVLWVYQMGESHRHLLEDYVVARVRLMDGLSRHCRSTADAAKALWNQHADEEV